MWQSYKESGITNMSLNDWAESQDSPMFKYWYGVLNFEVDVFMVIRGFREADLKLLIATLKKAVELCFSLDHYNYARWLSVFIQDLEILSVENSTLFSELSKHLSVTSSKAKFSKMAYDQKHEQNNKKIKSTSGYINLGNKEDKSFLRKLEICFPEILQYLEVFEDENVDLGDPKLKEQSVTFGEGFHKDCAKVSSKLVTNPFSNLQFQKLNSTLLFPNIIVNDCKRLFEIGKKQYKNFVETRFILGSADVIQTPIPKNSLKLPANLKAVLNDSPQIKLMPAILTKVRDACDVRKDAAKDLFCQEFTKVPECLVKDGKPFHNNKSDLLDIIAPKTEIVDKDSVIAQGLVVDLSVIIRSEASIVSSELTYKDFATHILERVQHMAEKDRVTRVDIVQDTYDPFSIKGTTREERGVGSRMIFEQEDALPADIDSFLKNDGNKTELNKLISQLAARPTTWTWDGEVVVTYGKRVMSRSDGVQDIMRWIDGVHEEADNRMIVHIVDMIRKSIINIKIRTVDTDVIVIILAFMPQLIGLDENVKIWVDFGTGDHRRLIFINVSFETLGESLCLALLFYHCSTGCDSTCSFYRKTKKFWFELWMKHPSQGDVTSAFQQLSWLPSETIVRANLGIIEKFVMSAFSSDVHAGNTINETRYSIFLSSTSNNLREIPPCKDALEHHVLRSAYQAGWI